MAIAYLFDIISRVSLDETSNKRQTLPQFYIGNVKRCLKPFKLTAVNLDLFHVSEIIELRRGLNMGFTLKL